jgi:hypothetical protein
MRDFADFSASGRLLARGADVPDYTWFGGSCVRIRALAPSRSERWTPSRRPKDTAGRVGLTLLPGPRRGASPDPPADCSTTACSGDALDRAQPVFDAIASKTVRLEPETGRVSRVMLVATAWTVGIVESLRAHLSRGR